MADCRLPDMPAELFATTEPSLCQFSHSSKCLGDMGRASISGILAFDDHELEHIHDFIQWCFLSPEPIESPILTMAEIVQFGELKGRRRISEKQNIDERILSTERSLAWAA
jgi:hypothetical protein